MKKTLLSLFLLLSCLSSFSQSFLSDKIYFGGGGGFSGGTGYFIVNVSPQVGYKITEKYSAGVGLIYQYVRFTDLQESVSNYGYNIFNRYNFTNQFFGYAEYERLSFQLDIDNESRRGFDSVFIGAGFSNPLGGRASLNASVLYNILYGDGTDSPYQSPWVFRVGIGVGLF